MDVVIVIRKEVEDSDEGKDTYDLVVAGIQEILGLKITGNYSNHYESEET